MTNAHTEHHGQPERNIGGGMTAAQPAQVHLRLARLVVCSGLLLFSGCVGLRVPPAMDVVQLYDGPSRARAQLATVYAKFPAFISKCGDREPEGPPSVYVNRRFKTFATSPGEGWGRRMMNGSMPGNLRPQVLELLPGPQTLVLNYASGPGYSLQGRTVSVDLKPGHDYCITATQEKMTFLQGMARGAGLPQRFKISYQLTDADTGQIIEDFGMQ